MAAYDDKSPLETAIEEGRREIWNIMREGLELSEAEKLEQLFRMIVAGKMDQDNPWEEFNELLSTLPVKLVFICTSSCSRIVGIDFSNPIRPIHLEV